MANQTVKVLRLEKPGNALAVWLAGHHPDLFLTLVRQAKVKGGLKGLSDNGGTTTTFDASPAFDSSAVQLDTVTVDQTSLDTLPTNLLTDSNSSGAGFLSTLGNTATSIGTTIGGALSSAGSGLLTALGGVGSFLNTSGGQATLNTLAKTLAPTQQQVVQTQLGRTTVGGQPAPITYTTNAAGQLVPVYATTTPQGAVYQTLTNAGVASLAPSSLSLFLAHYGPFVALAAVGLVVFAVARRS